MTTEPADINSYDEVPYESYAFPQSHPDRLATIASLFGMSPTPIENCRVLELGCALGGNLLPIALGFPNSQCVGFDLSARQIADGNALVQQLDVRNIRLEQKSILDVQKEDGEFDYILCHGVYSWVPEAVREKILSICKTNLAPNGVAYISYNTYPGWRMRGMIRDMMLYHVAQFKEAKMRIDQAKALLDFMAKSVATTGSGTATAYATLLKDTLEHLRGLPDSYLYHDYLETVNEPTYFHEFVARANAHGLQYLGESEFAAMLGSGFAPQVTETLRKVAPEIIRMEQYLDFLRNRTFRQTLLCHAGLPLHRDITPVVLPRFEISCSAVPMSKVPDLQTEAKEQWKTPRGQLIQSGNSLTKAALLILSELYPLSVPYERLRELAWARLHPSTQFTEAQKLSNASGLLAAELLQCYALGVLELRQRTPRCLSTVGERPKVSELARYQASRGLKFVNQRHETILFDEFSRQLIRMLDGKSDRKALRGKLLELCESGALVAQQDGAPIKDREKLKAALDQMLAQALPNLARQAMLVE